MQHRVKTKIAAVLPALAVASITAPNVFAFGSLGSDVNDFCANFNGTTPYEEGDCGLCHAAGDFEARQEPEWTWIENDELEGFCPQVPNQPPAFDPVGNQMVSEGELLAFTVTASDPDGDAVSITAANLPTGAALQDNGDGSAEFEWTPDFDQAGNYAVLFTATDTGDPVASAAVEIMITVGDVNRPPALDPVDSQSVSEGEALLFAVTAIDPDGDPLVIEAANLPTGAILQDNGDGSADFEWIPGFDQAGNFAVLFTVTDTGNPVASDSAEAIITVGQTNRPPVLDPIGNRSIDIETTLDLTVTASDPDGDAVSFEAANLPSGASFLDNLNGTAEFTWTPAADQLGNFDVNFIVTDAGDPVASDQEAITITVGAGNRPPMLDPIGSRSVNEGELLAFTLTATDPDGDGLSYTADSLPAGASFTDQGDNSADFSWMPLFDQSGNFAITFTVTDSHEPPATDSEEVTVSVGDVNRPPVLSPIGNRSVQVGNLLSFTVTGIDPDGDNLAYTATDLPAGATFTDNGDGTAEFSWVPEPDQIGTSAVTITLADDGEPVATDSETVELGVEPEAETVVRIVRAAWNPRQSRLTVLGNQAPSGAPVRISDAERDVVIAETSVNEEGVWSARIHSPEPVPCRVSVEINGVFAQRDVDRAPLDCGDEATNLAPTCVIQRPRRDRTVRTGQPVRFDGLGTDADGNLPLSFAWDFGGGAPNSTLEDPGRVRFSSVGTFTVTLTVTDSEGLACTPVATRTITVEPRVEDEDEDEDRDDDD